MSIKKILLPGLGIGAWVIAAIIPVAAKAVAAGAKDYWVVSPYRDENLQKQSRENFEKKLKEGAIKPTDADFDRKVLSIYGNPYVDKQSLIVSGSTIQHPKEKPDLAFVLKPEGTNFLEGKTVLFFAKLFSAGGVITGAFFLILWLLLHWAAPARGARLASAE